MEPIFQEGSDQTDGEQIMSKTAGFSGDQTGSDTPVAPDKPKPELGHTGSVGLRIAAASLVAAGLSWLAISKTGAPSGEIVRDMASLDAGLSAAGATGAVVPLTFADGRVDMIYVGAPECSHCQEFMKGGFPALIEQARERDLDLVYMPMAMSAYGVSIAAVQTCALPSSGLDPAGVVQAGYVHLETLRAALAGAGVMRETDAPEEEASALVMAALADLHERAGAVSAFSQDCYAKVGKEIGAIMQSFSDDFGLTGTPGFYHTGADGKVYRTIGVADIASATKSLN